MLSSPAEVYFFTLYFVYRHVYVRKPISDYVITDYVDERIVLDCMKLYTSVL